MLHSTSSRVVRDCQLSPATAAAQPNSGLNCSRRQLFLQSGGAVAALTAAVALAGVCSAGQAQAAEVGLTLQDVTPAIAEAGALPSREAAVISIFESATPAVVTVFDKTLIVRGTEWAVSSGSGRGFTSIMVSPAAG